METTMNKGISTTREQSARLLQCGVDPKMSDMCWYKARAANKEGYTWILITENYRIRRNSVEFIPAWSLSTLLSLLPTSMMSANGTAYMLELSKLRMHDQWEVQWWFGGRRWSTSDKSKTYHKLWDKSPIEACVKAIEWLTANNYKLNEL